MLVSETNRQFVSTTYIVQNMNSYVFRLFTLILLTSTIWRSPTNASKWRMGFNSAFKGLIATSH